MSQLQLALSMVKDEKQSFFMYKMKERKITLSTHWGAFANDDSFFV